MRTRVLTFLAAGMLAGAALVPNVSVASADTLHCQPVGDRGDFNCTPQPETPCSTVVQAIASEHRVGPRFGAVLVSAAGGKAPSAQDIQSALVTTMPDYEKICEQANAAALPAPAVSANDQYSTGNGVKISQQIQSELLGSGYAGPFDVPSLLAAYQRTTSSPVRPL
jgi:hypothetical protein